MRCLPPEVPVYEMLANELLVHEVPVHEVPVHEVRAHEVPAHEVAAQEVAAGRRLSTGMRPKQSYAWQFPSRKSTQYWHHCTH